MPNSALSYGNLKHGTKFTLMTSWQPKKERSNPVSSYFNVWDILMKPSWPGHSWAALREEKQMLRKTHSPFLSLKPVKRNFMCVNCWELFLTSSPLCASLYSLQMPSSHPDQNLLFGTIRLEDLSHWHRFQKMPLADSTTLPRCALCGMFYFTPGLDSTLLLSNRSQESGVDATQAV